VAHGLSKIFSKSATARLLLRKYQHDAGEEEVNFKSISNTRFNCGFIQINNMLLHRAHVSKIVVDLKAANNRAGKRAANYMNDLLTDAFWMTLEQTKDALMPLQFFIVQCQARDIHLSDAMQLLQRAYAELSSLSSTNTYAQKVTTASRKYFEHICDPTSIFSICAALDPRSKRTFHGTLEERKLTWKFILNDIKRMLQHKKQSTEETTSDCLADTDWLEMSDQSKELDDRVRHQLRSFIEAKGLEPDATTNEARKWWATRATEPLIKDYASLYFSVQCTEVENEREFSSAGKLNMLARYQFINESSILLVYDQGAP
jgi:hypothetical protein